MNGNWILVIILLSTLFENKLIRGENGDESTVESNDNSAGANGGSGVSGAGANGGSGVSGADANGGSGVSGADASGGPGSNGDGGGSAGASDTGNQMTTNVAEKLNNEIMEKINKLINSREGHYENEEYKYFMDKLAQASNLTQDAIAAKQLVYEVIEQYNNRRLELENKISDRLNELHDQINSHADVECLRFYYKLKLTFEKSLRMTNSQKEKFLSENSVACPFDTLDSEKEDIGDDDDDYDDDDDDDDDDDYVDDDDDVYNDYY